VYLGEAEVEGQPALLAGDGLLAAKDEQLRAAPAAGFATVRFSSLRESFDQAVAPAPGGRFVAAANDLSEIRFARYSGPLPPTPERLNAQANWVTDRSALAAEERGRESSLAGGPAGLVLVYVSDGNVRLRRYDAGAGSFGASPLALPDEGAIDDLARRPGVAQDARGRVHVAWSTGHDGGRLRYARSDDGGATFGPAGNLATGEPVVNVRLAAAPDGSGFASWTGPGFTPVAIRVVALDPQPEPLPPPPPPDTPPVITPAPPADEDLDGVPDSVDRCPEFAAPDGCPPASDTALSAFARDLTRALGRTSIRSLRSRKRVSLAFTAVAAGRLTVTAKLGAATVLTANQAVQRAGRSTVRVRLTRAGARTLRRARLRVRVVYRDLAGRSFTADARVTLRR
jgi:hypothetical protein